MSGFFTPADIAAFLNERRHVHAQLTCAPNQHLTQNDVRSMNIQPQEAVVAFRRCSPIRPIDPAASPSWSRRR